MIDRLERGGRVRRVPDPADRRRVPSPGRPGLHALDFFARAAPAQRELRRSPRSRQY